jgi:tripartite ATP-independent transporter DctM subunit
MSVLAVLLIVFLVLLALGVPIAVGMGVAGMAAVLVAPNLPLVVVGQRMLGMLDSFPFLALPFFVLAGLFMERGGMTQHLVNFASLFVGRMTGGLAQVVVGTNLVMSGTSGSATADCAATGTVLIPGMTRAGYSTAFAAALTAAASTVGPIIPPSIMFVLYGSMSNVSIGKLFLGGVIPGLIMALYLSIAAYLISRRRKYPKLPPVSGSEAISIVIKAFPAVMMPVVIVGGIIGGVFTPTEGGAVAAMLSFVLSMFVYRQMKWRDVMPVLAIAGIMTAAVMLIVASSEIFGWVLARERIPDALASGFTSLTSNPLVFLALINILLFLLGVFFEPLPLLILMTPVLLPILPAYGIDPVHFGVIMTLNVTLGLLTPPVGMNIFIVCAIGKISMRAFSREIWPFLLALIAALLVVTFVPQTVMFLPELIGN